MPLLDALLLDPCPFEVWIAKRTDGLKGSGTASDPYDGSTQAKFDARMSEQAANTCIHLGPGLFQTNGYADNVGGWQIKSGMKICGSGIGVTTLQLVNHSATEYFFAIGHDISAGATVDFADVSDLTIDCNLANAGAATASCAVRLMGNHVRIQRVKAINWGSKATAKPCSVISCITALPATGVFDVANAGIEDCIVVSPAAANVAACTALSAGNPDDISFIADGHGRGPCIRNCFVDCGVTTPNPDPTVGKYRGLAMGWCRGGVVEGNQIHNCDIGGPYQDGKRSALDVIVRNNHYRNVARGPSWNLGTLAPETGPGSFARSGTVGTVSGISNFTYFDAGVRVKIVTTPSDYTGLYLIQSKTATTFTVPVPNSGTALVEATSVRKVYGVKRALIESNVIELGQVSGSVAIGVLDNNDSSPYSELPDYVHGDVIVRNNKVRYVDGAAPNDSGATIIDLRGTKNAMVQNNVLDTIATLPLNNRRCGSATYFNNRTPGGVLLRGWNNDTSRKYDELETEAEDALVMSMFNES